MRPRLSSFELAWTDAAFDAIYPAPPRSLLPAAQGGRYLPHGVASMHPARFFDSVLASIPFEQSLGLRVTLWMIALAPLFTIRRLGTIASIDEGERGRVLERLVTRPIYVVRQLAMSFKAIATLLYAKSEAVRAAMSTPLAIGASFEPRLEAASSSQPSSEPGLVSATRLTSRATAKKSGGAHEHAA